MGLMFSVVANTKDQNFTTCADPDSGGHWLLLCGGVGGAKLALGMRHALGDDQLTIIVNTGDDFKYCGLWVSPDLDTVAYTLTGLANQANGWGRSDETWNALGEMQRFGGDPWFQLGDMDIGLSMARHQKMENGQSLTRFMQELLNSCDVPTTISPMTEDRVATIIETDQGKMSFQDYFVREGCKPRCIGIEYRGAQTARPTQAALDTLERKDLKGIVFANSNPYLSIEPILAIAGLRSAIREAPVPKLAVSPIINGQSVKGPLAKMMMEFGVEVSAASIAEHYDYMIDALLVDRQDRQLIGSAKGRLIPSSQDLLMESLEQKVRLAQEVISVCDRISFDRRSAGSNA